MRRTQIQIDDRMYEKLRQRAYARRMSLSAIVRETLAAAFGSEPPATAGPARFEFIGAGRSVQRRGHPVSMHHDEALAQAVSRPRRRK